MLDKNDCLEVRKLRIFAHQTATEIFLICGNDSPKTLHMQTYPNFGELLNAAITRKHFERPQTFELMLSFIRNFEIDIEEIFIDEKLDEQIFAAKIACKKCVPENVFPQQELLDARPSDALLISAALRKKVLVKKSLLENSESDEILLKQMEAELDKNKKSAKK